MADVGTNLLSNPTLFGPDDTPDISFLVATYNVAPFIEAAIGSALAQENCRVEVIVVDDCSTDSTPAIVARLAEADGRVHLIRRARQGGASAARNDALRAASGTWLAVLDGDDLLLPARSRTLLALAHATSADLVADNIIRFGEKIPDAPSALPQGPAPYLIQLEPAAYVRANRPMARGPNLGYLKPMIRRSFLREAGLSYDENLPIGEDYKICLQALLAGGRFIVSSDAFYKYRVREGSLSWRLTERDVDRMAQAQAAIVTSFGSAASPALLRAVEDYDHALARARAIQQVADAAMGRRWSEALGKAARRPESWGFLAGVAWRHAGRRVPVLRRRAI